jgi:hypothetical protein
VVAMPNQVSIAGIKSLFIRSAVIPSRQRFERVVYWWGCKLTTPHVPALKTTSDVNGANSPKNS